MRIQSFGSVGSHRASAYFGKRDPKSTSSSDPSINSSRRTPHFKLANTLGILGAFALLATSHLSSGNSSQNQSKATLPVSDSSPKKAMQALESKNADPACSEIPPTFIPTLYGVSPNKMTECEQKKK